MAPSETTRWSLIAGAAAGDAAAREEFARRYEPVVRAYLGARWRGTPLLAELDDAAQEVFLDCFKRDGALGRADPEGPGRFRTYLYGVVRNVALRVEERRAQQDARRGSVDLDHVAASDEPLSKAFDRAWAQALLGRAAALQRERARDKGPAALRRVELLRARFAEGLPIREIARMWGEDAARLHHEYAAAREEFKEALRDLVAGEEGASGAALSAECARLLDCLG